FDSESITYCMNYDNEQGVSKYFLNYIDGLIDIFQSKWNLKDKTILEIGCGKGTFLKRICEKCKARGVGFDTAYDRIVVSKDVVFKKRYFDKRSANFSADFVFLRHVLEHIPCPYKFLKSIIQNIDITKNPKIIIELPDFDWIIKNKEFYDIYYEHCNYFTKLSLQNLAESLGLRVDMLFNTFGGQYMVLVATPCDKISQTKKYGDKLSDNVLNNFAEYLDTKIVNTCSSINKID
ncbi:unnamed protein product, partial [marine sediment metagenome]